MNDWLDYEGSRSARASSDNYIAHADQGSGRSIRINSSLDDLNNQSATVISDYKNLLAAYSQFVNTARTLKAKIVMCQAKHRQWKNRADKIGDNINEATMLSSIQRTAFTNKLNTIIDRVDQTADKLDVSGLNDLIERLQSSMRR